MRERFAGGMYLGEIVDVFSTIGFWLFAIVLIALSCLWGFLERWNKRFQQGICHRNLGHRGARQ